MGLFDEEEVIKNFFEPYSFVKNLRNHGFVNALKMDWGRTKLDLFVRLKYARASRSEHKQHRYAIKAGLESGLYDVQTVYDFYKRKASLDRRFAKLRPLSNYVFSNE